MTKPALTGSISTGTLRYEHVIPKMLDALRELSPARHGLVQDQHAELLDNLDPEVWDDGHVEDIVTLFDRIADEIAATLPEGWYFGTHPGDGADFGVWQVEE